METLEELECTCDFSLMLCKMTFLNQSQECSLSVFCWNPCARIHEEENVHCSQRYGPIAEGEQLTQ